jgi:hypothetical protein
MLSRTHAHHPPFGHSWSAANAALTLLLTLLFLIFLLLFLTIVAQPAWAQSSVPPTARQAATMPQYASRLANPAKLRPSPNENGPINGTTGAWTIWRFTREGSTNRNGAVWQLAPA